MTHKTELEKLIEKDIKQNNHQRNMDKVQKIALLEKEGKRPVVIDIPGEKHVLFLEVDRKLNVHWENWEKGGKVEARQAKIRKVEETN